MESDPEESIHQVEEPEDSDPEEEIMGDIKESSTSSPLKTIHIIMEFTDVSLKETL